MTNKEIELLDKLELGEFSIDDLKVIKRLNQLVLIPDHQKHQAIVFALQKAKHPSSIPFLRKALENGFEMYEYTCSDDAVIAKWFSHALFSMGTAEAIQVIKDFSTSENEEIAKEMKYRLAKIK
jgi:HEAT repeat protein